MNDAHDMPSRSVLDGEERALSEVVSHASADARICVFALADGRRRFVDEAEWRAGAALVAKPEAGGLVVTSQSPNADKIALFRSLFRGRDDVYAHGYTKRDGTMGYGPVCANERTGRCPRWTRANTSIECGTCPRRSYVPLSDEALKAHFKGRDPNFRDVCGLYVLTKACKTRVLVADFDKTGWERETELYCDACEAHGLVPCVERSRSGNGAHAWLFFEDEVDASLARDLGSALITWAMERSAGMGFSAYDRLFPTQATLAANGLGNLIALPFQGAAMRAGNSVFVDKSLTPYRDQWRFLSGVTKVGEAQAEDVVARAGSGVLGALAPTGDKSHAPSAHARADGSACSGLVVS